MTKFSKNPVDNDIRRLSFKGSGNTSTRVMNKATIIAIHPSSGKIIISITRLIIKKVTDPAKDLLKIFAETVILPTIAANESAIVNTNTAAMAISLLNMKNVTVADMNKYVAPVMCFVFSSSLSSEENTF